MSRGAKATRSDTVSRAMHVCARITPPPLAPRPRCLYEGAMSSIARSILPLALLGCGAAPDTGPSPESVVASPPAATPATTVEEVADAAPYEAHEWGFIDVEGSAAEIAAGPGRPPRRLMPIRKPVLYFHLAPGTEPLAIDVSARIVGGTIYEAYPPDTRPSPDTARWSATLSAAHCPTTPGGGARESRDQPACATPDGICEVAELRRYDASSAACVESDGVRAGMLFYRGMASPRLPLQVERKPDGSVRVTAVGDTAGAPGAVLRVSTNLSGPWPLGRVVLSRADMPARGASVILPVGSVEVDRGATRAELAAHLGALGLDEAEASAFLGAWTIALFGPEPGASGRAWENAPPLPQDAILYFLPEAAVDGIATLELTPPPRRVRRAYMVRAILPATPTG